MPKGILVPYWLLEKISLFTKRSPEIQAVILRALKAGVATVVAILLTAAAAGILFPAEWSPILIISITVILQTVDKWLRSDVDNPPVEVPIEVEVPLEDGEMDESGNI